LWLRAADAAVNGTWIEAHRRSSSTVEADTETWKLNSNTEEAGAETDE
jgi:hypothetical protein